MTAAARLFALPGEASPASQWCQRRNGGTHTWRHRSQGGFDADLYSVEPLDESPLHETTAKRYITTNHYSTSYPAALSPWALRDRDRRLVGVAVIGVPMSTAVLTNVFPDLEPITEKRRTLPAVPKRQRRIQRRNLVPRPCLRPSHRPRPARHRHLRRPRTPPRRRPTPLPRPHRHHLPSQPSRIPRTLHPPDTASPEHQAVLPDGQILSARAAQKVRAGEP